MPYLRESDIVYSDVIDSFISEILKYEMSVIVSSYYSHPPRAPGSKAARSGEYF